MTADEIRNEMIDGECPSNNFFLREIAAQLAEINANLAETNSILKGGNLS